MFNYIQALIVILLISCQSSTSQQKEAGGMHESIASIRRSEKSNGSWRDTTGFLSNCQKWIYGSFTGYLQGLEASKDSLGEFGFYECYDCKESFRIIFVQKTKPGADADSVIRKRFENGCSDQYANFNCFVFVYPMRDPDKQEDVHAMNIDFPVTVKVYERIAGDHWKFLKKVRAKKFRELSILEFKTIYHIL